MAFIAIFSLPNNAKATEYEPDILVKTADNPIIYYIASDKQKYPFPDHPTFQSWYPNEANIKIISNIEMIKIPSGKAKITIRPGVKLVKFPNSPKVYIVKAGALLRWMKNEKTADWYYGKNWQKDIVTLNLSQFETYIFGDSLDTGEKFSKTKTVNSVYNADAELKNRNVITVKNLKLAAVKNEELPVLKSISENLKADLQPRFNYTINKYSIIAQYSEDILNLKPLALSKQASVYVNGTLLENNAAIKLALNTGLNNFEIKASLPNGKSLSYYLEVIRELPSANAYLNSISENLKDNILPKFNANIYEYELKADYNEIAAKLTATAADKKSTVQIDSTEKTPSYQQTEETLLNYGENAIKIQVRAENGRAKTYNLTIIRKQNPNIDATNLASLAENISEALSPAFDPNMTRYFLRAGLNETKVIISAKAKDKNASIFINGTKVSSKEIELLEYRNDVKVIVRLEGGFEKEYLISIYRNDF